MAYEIPYYHPRGGLQKVRVGSEGATLRRQFDGRMAEEVGFEFYQQRALYQEVETSISSGTVYTFLFDSDNIYLFVSSTAHPDAPIYPLEISWYADFDGTTVSTLLATRY